MTMCSVSINNYCGLTAPHLPRHNSQKKSKNMPHMVWWCHCQYYPSLLFCLCVFCFSPPNRVPMLVILRVMGAVGSCVTTMGWVMAMEEVVVMGPLGRVVVLVGHRCWWRWWSPVYNRTRVRSMVFVVMRTVAWNYWSWCGWCWCKSTIVKIVREAPIVIEAIVGKLGGGQGGAQGEKQNSQLHG